MTRRGELLRRSADLDEEQARIKRELAALETTSSDDVYTTAPGGYHPGTRRWFVEHVRTMPGARRSGGKRGRGVVWTISRAEFEAGLSAHREPKPSSVAPVVDIEEIIRAGGYRATRRTA